MAFAARSRLWDNFEIEVLDRLPDRSARPRATRPLASGWQGLALRALQLQRQWARLDREAYRQMRRRLPGIAHRDTPLATWQAWLRETGLDALPDHSPSSHGGYDDLDRLLNGLLSRGSAPRDTSVTESGLVPYHKTPARVLLELARRAMPGRDDVFVDVGSGLGQAPLFLHALTGVPTRGLEIDPALCAYARCCAEWLGFADVAFDEADARHFDYAQASIVFMYTPCTGSALSELLVALRKGFSARTLAPRVFSLGPCTPVLAAQAWLKPLDAHHRETEMLAGFVYHDEALDPAPRA